MVVKTNQLSFKDFPKYLGKNKLIGGVISQLLEVHTIVILIKNHWPAPQLTLVKPSLIILAF